MQRAAVREKVGHFPIQGAIVALARSLYERRPMLKRALAAFILPATLLASAHCSSTPSNPSDNPDQNGQGDDDDDTSTSDGGKPTKDGGKHPTDASEPEDTGPRPDAPPPLTDHRPLPPEVAGRQGVCYSGYRKGQSPDTQTYPSEAEIKEDLQLLVRGKWTFLRLFDCSTHAERVLKVIKDNNFDLKVMQGVWIAGAKAEHDKENLEQIDKCVKLINQYPDVVAAVSVGNETLDYWSSVRVFPPDLAGYLQTVRSQITQPVTTDDMYPPFTMEMVDGTDYSNVIDVVHSMDFLALHVYAFLDAPWDSWDWKQEGTPKGHGRAMAMMNEGLKYTKEAYSSVRESFKKHNVDIPIVIGEIGWKASPTAPGENKAEPFMAHQANQKIFYEMINDWVYGASKEADGPATAFFFAAFDEPWKGIDDGWGLFDTNRKSRYVIWNTFADKKPAGAPNYTDNDALYYNK